MTAPVPWLRRVRIANFRSIAQCDVQLGPLTLLVGPNGSGKSNFLEALRFAADAVATTPYQAVEAHGGFGEILRRIPDQADSCRVELGVTVPWGPTPEQHAVGRYAFEVAPASKRGERPIEVINEICELRWNDKVDGYRVDAGQVEDTLGPRGTIGRDRLYLQSASVHPNRAPLFALLQGMRFYSLDAATLRRPERESDGAELGRHGEHLPDVLGELQADHAIAKQRLDDYLAAVVPGVEGIDRQFPTSSYVAVELRQRFGQDDGITFGPDSMSDGTIRAAGILAALFQPAVRTGQISLVGLEEPELALHPAAAGVLFDALTEASGQVQVIASSQSADLLDRDDIDPATVRAVTSVDGLTVIGELDEASQIIVREKKFTLGELMRSNQLSPKHVA
jgi:predicted ATPase